MYVVYLILVVQELLAVVKMKILLITLGAPPFKRPHPQDLHRHSLKHHQVKTCSTVDHARTWLTANRFGQFLSLLANYICQDLLRLSRRDLVDLCGAADGIRLYNALRSHTVKVVYIAMGTEICMTNHAWLIFIRAKMYTHTHNRTHAQFIKLYVWNISRHKSCVPTLKWLI